MYTQVHNGDRIVVTPSTEGEPAVLELGKLSELGDALQVYVNGKRISLPKTAEVNGHRENESTGSARTMIFGFGILIL